MNDQTPRPLKPMLARPWRRTFLVLNEYAAHEVSLIGVLAGFKILEYLVRLTTQGQPLIFWKGSPYFEFNAQWFFDTADMVLLLAILILGVGLVIITAIRGES
jgi:hypothetical protein